MQDSIAGSTRDVDLLTDRTLFRERAYVGGHWCVAGGGETIAVQNPATGALIGNVPALDRDQTRTAIEAAERAFERWRRLLPQERGDLLEAWCAAVRNSREDLALLMTLEQGKPLDEARGEIDYAADFLKWYAEEAKRLNGETIASHLPNRRLSVQPVPLGVVAAVTPWNFPSAMITRKAGAALAAGCTLVVKPASETPFSALALAALAERVGIPPGVLSVITGRPDTVVGEICADPRVRALSFTGSTRVGKKLLGDCAATVKRVSLELGGHAPMLIFPDVDLETAVESAISAKFQTTGQDCLAANRIYVHRLIYESFVKCFAEAAGALKAGNGLTNGVRVGPMINRRGFDKCSQQVADTLDRGARLLCGGGQHSLGGLFFEPTVLADVTPEMSVCREETFGPVAALCAFESEAEAVSLANDSDYGLVAYVFTKDHSRICRLSDELKYGMLAVNCVKLTGYPIPFGGSRESGLGREGGRWGLDAFTELRYVCAAFDAA